MVFYSSLSDGDGCGFCLFVDLEIWKFGGLVGLVGLVWLMLFYSC